MIELIEIGKIEKKGLLLSFQGKFIDELNKIHKMTIYGTEHSIKLYKTGKKYDYSLKKIETQRKEKKVSEYTKE